ncbi:MAG TPA: serine hydrolase domain-containing protein [Candidatus Binataceae bacterium]|nr:serine hydrolase domain-containing protein [Candidatus Binataceae bacterium]
MSENVPIEGTCQPRFQSVRKAFAENFASRGEVGAAAAVTLDGKPVVDLWGGFADVAKTTAWTRDTLVNVFSTTKGLTAMCAHRLVEQRKLDLDAPVAKYWPEFAQAGKQNLPVRYLLSHRAGLPAIRKPLPTKALFSWETMTAALAEQDPWWEPGTRHGYHALTFGWLVGEVVRRISGKSLGTYFRDEIAAPLGLDCHIGLDQKHDARVASIIPAPLPAPGEPNPFLEMMKDPESVAAKTMMNPPDLIAPRTVNSREWRGAEIPAANGHTTARALARVYGALSRGGEVDGVRILTPPSIERCYTEQSCGADAVLTIPMRFSLGFILSQPLPGSSLGPNPQMFGHPGAGGSIGLADPDTKIGIGYTMNKMGAGLLIDSRAEALIKAVYESLD